MSAKGLRKLEDGERSYEAVRRACESSAGPSEADATSLRSALETLRSAMNWLEDTEHFERAHTVLDKAGNLARTEFPEGCQLAYEDGTYFQQCPVALAHNRTGMSVGFITKSVECSICRQDPEDCPHITGRIYDGKRCVRIIMEADILDISIVARPNMPDARIMKISVDLADLRAGLGEDFTPGVPVNCDNCLLQCDGVARPFEDDLGTLRLD